MIVSRHSGDPDVPIINVTGPFEGLTHQTLAGAELGAHDAALWQHHMTHALTIPPHYHICEETVVVLSGTLRFHLGAMADKFKTGDDPLADAEIVDVGPEATCVVPARQIHAYEIVGVPARVLIFLPDPHGATLLPTGEPMALPWTT